MKEYIENDGFHYTDNENIINEEIKNIEKLLYNIKAPKIIEGTATEGKIYDQ